MNESSTLRPEQQASRVLASLRSTDVMMVSHAQQIFAGVVLNVLVNVVVLNLFVEFADAVVIDSFWISVLTAVLVTAMLAVISNFEHHIHHFFFEQHSWRIAGLVHHVPGPLRRQVADSRGRQHRVRRSCRARPFCRSARAHSDDDDRRPFDAGHLRPTRRERRQERGMRKRYGPELQGQR